jgi:hypothetical protein
MSEARQRALARLRREHPGQYRELVALVAEAERRDERRRCEDSFLEFVKRAWREIDPAPLSLAWFHEVIIEHLEAICFGELRTLIINCPPRCSKSSLCSILYPAWVWCRSDVGPQSGPGTKFFCVSYGAILAEEIAVKMRRLVMGSWYQSLWGDRVKLLPDQSSRANFGNTAGGERISSSIEGGLLGRGGACQIIDDPHSIAGAESDLERRATLRAFSEGLPTRITDPSTVAKILVCQRTHEDDVTNLALETWTDAKHLMLPARFEPDRCCAEDQRTYPGELLWPEKWPETELRKVELGLQGLEKGQAGLSSYAVSAQLQQSPVPRGGGIIPRTDWRVWPEEIPPAGDLQKDPRNPGEFLVALPPVSFVLISVDTAFSEADTADFNGIVCLGVWHRRRELASRSTAWFAGRWGGRPPDLSELREQVEEDTPLDQPRVILMEAINTRAKLNDPTLGRNGKPIGLVQRLIDLARRRRADRILVENANRGQDVLREIERQANVEEFSLELFNPREHGDKVARAWSVQPLFSQGLVSAPAHLVPGVDHFGNPCVQVHEFQWVEAVVSQMQRVPQGKQDLADATSMGLIFLRRNGFLELNAEFIKNELQTRTWKPTGFNVAKHYLGQ